MMRKKLSLLLALSLMVSLVPMSAFASSDNYVDRVAQVKDDHKFDKNDAPRLSLENDKGHWGHEENITLKLENADWLSHSTFETEMEGLIKEETVSKQVYGVTADVKRRSDSRIEITLTSTTDGDIEKDLIVNIPMLVEMDGEAAKVNIESQSNTITEEAKLFANGTSGNTRVYIDDTVTFSNIKGIETITIEENAAGTLQDISGKKYIKLKLDKDFKFQEAGSITSKLFKEKETYTVSELIAAGNAEIDDEELKVYIKENGKTGEGIELKDAHDDSIKYAEKIEFIELEVNPGKDAKEGKVKVNISSDISDIKTTSLEIGEYADYKVEVKADGDAKEIYSGRYETNVQNNEFGTMSTSNLTLTSDEAHELQTLIIDEKAEGSWTEDKSVVVTFPTWVKVIGVDVDGKTGSVDHISATVDENEYEFNVKGSEEEKQKVELTFYVSVEAGHEGDIEATVGGRALDEEQKVVLGKAINPVKVEAEVAKIKAGVRDQEIGKITITEANAGAIEEDKNIVIELDKDMDWDDEPEVKVTSGNLEIDEDNVKVDDNILTIPVEGESTEASTIEITDSRVKVDRAIAEGSIKVEIKGDALMENAYDSELHKDATIGEANKDAKKSDLLDDYGFFNNDYYAKVEVANVITPADQNTNAGEAVQFVIGSSEYKIGEEVKQADVAPYIKDGRTMLPVKYVAEAMGANNVLWNEATRTVTIIKGDKMAQITIGSNIINVGGMAIPMDTVAEIKDGRTMLPISYIATALGATAEWDASTQTVTIK